MIFKMYVVLVYDIRERRVVRVLKICREYLHRIQNSVFEGEISESDLRELKMRLSEVMDLSVDSLIVFRFRGPELVKREVVGNEEFPVEFMF